MTSYSEKLLSPKWQRRRLEIMSRDGFACTSCGTTEKTLHVHHKRYIAGHEPWDHPDDYLVTLCRDCHDQGHGREPPPSVSRRKHPSFIRPVIELLCFQTQFGGLAERSAITPGVGLPGVNQAELKALDALLELLQQNPTISSVGEYFRETPHGPLFAEIEAALIFREETQCRAEVVRQEFEDGWRKMVQGIRIAEAWALDEKSKLQPLTAAEKVRYRQLHEILTKGSQPSASPSP